MSEIIVRYPPSPTGLLHIGTVRTCLYNFLFAKKRGGKIIYRVEDTDKERSTVAFENNISEGLKNLGLKWDEGPIYQSQRTEIYTHYLQQLLAEEKAYYCFCSADDLQKERDAQIAAKRPPRYSGKCREVSLTSAQKRISNGEKAVIRFRVPENRGDIFFVDLVRGEVKIHAREIADFVIAKNLETPLYHFVVVVDDHKMNISHIIRGEDHISNTPKQILLFESFSWNIPKFAHLPLILNADKSKLSKRKHTVSVDDFLADGILPEALLNYLAMLGWNTADEQEIFSLSELQEKFSLERVQKGGAIFSMEKLLWMNGHYIRTLSPDILLEKASPFLSEKIFSSRDEAFTKAALMTVQARMKKLSETADFLRFFFVSAEDFSPDISLLENKKMKVNLPLAKENLEMMLSFLEKKPASEWHHDHLKETIIAEISRREKKNGAVLWPLRVALSGESFSPSPFEIADVLGKKESIMRVKKTMALLSEKI